MPVNKKFSLTKEESEYLQSVVQMRQQQEMLLTALNIQFQAYATSVIFPRLSIPTESFENSSFNLSSGVLEISQDQPEEVAVNK